MLLRKIIAIVWAILSVPAILFALITRICDSPYGCIHSPTDFFFSYFFLSVPVFFLAGAVGGWLREEDRRLGLILLLLPLVPVLALTAVYSYPIFAR